MESNRLVFLSLMFLVISACNVKLYFSSKATIPLLQTVSPGGGASTGGETITLSGLALTSIKSVTLGSSRCAITTVSETKLECRTGPGQVSWAKIKFGTKDGEFHETTLRYAYGAVVLGQSTFETAEPANGTLGAAFIKGFASDGTNLFVSDFENDRVLYWKYAPTTFVAPDLVIKGSFLKPEAVCTDGIKLYLTEPTSHRLLVWNKIPTSGTTAPDFVLGQSDLSGSSANGGGNISAATLRDPSSIYCDADHIAVSDSGNNRVLIWDHPITQNGQAADRVLGQASFTEGLVNRGGAAGLGTMNTPRAISFDGSYFWVADRSNSRVLGYQGFPSSFQNAFLVLGQTTITATSGSTSVTRLRTPAGLYSDGTTLYVVDSGSHRVVGWNLASGGGPTSWAHGRAHDLRVGQITASAGSANTGGVSGSTFYSPTQIGKIGTSTLVADYSNSRILGWNGPILDQMQADYVIGQENLSRGDYRAGAYSASSMIGPADMTMYDGELYIVSYRASRLVKFSSIPSTNNAPADVVVGQPNMNSGARNFTGALTLNGYTGYNVTGISINSTDGKTYMADSSANRVLVWNTPPQLPNTPADFILGQVNETANASSTTANGLRSVNNVCQIGSKLYVADTVNHRVLGWNTLPSTSGEAAQFVLGQSDFGASFVAANRGSTPGAETLSSPLYITCEANRLIVVDSGNNRILVWNSLPGTTGTPADLVIGQPDFSSVQAGSSYSQLYAPRSLLTKNNKLYVTDSMNHRILVWNQFPTTNGTSADMIFGQSGPGLSMINRGARDVKIDSLNEPRAVISIDDDRIGVVDKNNHRVLILPNL